MINSYFLFAYDFEYNFNYYEDFSAENQPENPLWGNIEYHKALHPPNYDMRFGYTAETLLKIDFASITKAGLSELTHFVDK